MSNIDKQAREELRKRYTPPEIPKCKICGSELSIQRCGGSEPTVYACDGYEADPDNDGMVRMSAGRYIADKHYEESRYIDWIKGGDLDVVALLDELEAKDRRNAELNSTLERWAVDRAQSASELDEAEKRIAELEAREVKLPDRKSSRFWPGDAFEFDSLGYQIAVESAIKSAGIKIAAGTAKGE